MNHEVHVIKACNLPKALWLINPKPYVSLFYHGKFSYKFAETPETSEEKNFEWNQTYNLMGLRGHIINFKVRSSVLGKIHPIGKCTIDLHLIPMNTPISIFLKTPLDRGEGSTLVVSFSLNCRYVPRTITPTSSLNKGSLYFCISYQNGFFPSHPFNCQDSEKIIPPVSLSMMKFTDVVDSIEFLSRNVDSYNIWSCEHSLNQLLIGPNGWTESIRLTLGFSLIGNYVFSLASNIDSPIPCSFCVYYSSSETMSLTEPCFSIDSSKPDIELVYEKQGIVNPGKTWVPLRLVGKENKIFTFIESDVHFPNFGVRSHASNYIMQNIIHPSKSIHINIMNYIPQPILLNPRSNEPKASLNIELDMIYENLLFDECYLSLFACDSSGSPIGSSFNQKVFKSSVTHVNICNEEIATVFLKKMLMSTGDLPEGVRFISLNVNSPTKSLNQYRSIAIRMKINEHLLMEINSLALHELLLPGCMVGIFYLDPEYQWVFLPTFKYNKYSSPEENGTPASEFLENNRIRIKTIRN